MAARPTWQGHLKLSLVTCPVALYTATSSSSHVSFHLINPETNNRIRMVPTDPDAGPVERSDLVKGYEVSKDEYVLFDDEDFDKVRLESTRTISIDEFVDEDDIDRLYWNDPFYVVPEKGVGAEAFAVIRDAMQAAGKVAIARLVMSSRERVVTIGARDKGMFVTTLRDPREVRSTTAYFDEIPDIKADPEMLQLAEKLIEQKVTSFQPEQYEDRYESALMEMIKEKLKGHKPIIAAAPERGNVINLMDALKASLGQAKPAAPSKSKGEAAPAKKATTKPSLKDAVAASKAASAKAPAKKKAS